jgi:hypothetical protein
MANAGKRLMTMGEKVDKMLPLLGEPEFQNYERRFLRSVAGHGFGSVDQEKLVDQIYARHFPVEVEQ